MTKFQRKFWSFSSRKPKSICKFQRCLLLLKPITARKKSTSLFRAIHTIKGSAAGKLGLKRLGGIAHRVEDLIGRLREGESATRARSSICAGIGGHIKKTLHKQWNDESEMRISVDSLLNRISEIAPAEAEEPAASDEESNEAVEAKSAKSRRRRMPSPESGWRNSGRRSGRKVGYAFHCSVSIA